MIQLKKEGEGSYVFESELPSYFDDELIYNLCRNLDATFEKLFNSEFTVDIVARSECQFDITLNYPGMDSGLYHTCSLNRGFYRDSLVPWIKGLIFANLFPERLFKREIFSIADSLDFCQNTCPLRFCGKGCDKNYDPDSIHYCCLFNYDVVKAEMFSTDDQYNVWRSKFFKLFELMADGMTVDTLTSPDGMDLTAAPDVA